MASGQGYVLDAVKRSFAYLPYVHSESHLIHAQAIALFSQAGLEKTLSFEQSHTAIIDDFGRFPHRNAILGRTCTAEELVFFEPKVIILLNKVGYK